MYITSIHVEIFSTTSKQQCPHFHSSLYSKYLYVQESSLTQLPHLLKLLLSLFPTNPISILHFNWPMACHCGPMSPPLWTNISFIRHRTSLTVFRSRVHASGQPLLTCTHRFNLWICADRNVQLLIFQPKDISFIRHQTLLTVFRSRVHAQHSGQPLLTCTLRFHLTICADKNVQLFIFQLKE